MKKTFLGIVTLFYLTAHVGWAMENDTIKFEENEFGQYPLAMLIVKISDSLYQFQDGNNNRDAITHHRFTVVNIAPDNHEPQLYLIAHNKESKEYYAMPLLFIYEDAEDKKNELNLISAEIPPKVSLTRTKSFFVLSVAALTIFGGYEAIRKTIKWYKSDQVAKAKAPNK